MTQLKHSLNDSPCSACFNRSGCELPVREKAHQLSLDEFWHVHAAWSQATFGTDAERGPQGPLKHLAKEVHEALANPGDASEFADLIFLTFDAARRAGHTYDDLVAAVNLKLMVNKHRVWPKPTSSTEPVEHVRD